MKKYIICLMVVLLITSCKTKQENSAEKTPLNNSTSNIDNIELLKEAIRENDLTLVNNFLKEGNIDLEPKHVNGFINTPLAYAVQFGNIDSIKILLDYGADINGQVSYGDVPLLKALENNKLDIAQYLIEQGADLNIPNSFGYSPFTGICLSGISDLVQLSLDNGARINENYMVTNTSGFGKFNFNALQMAVKNSHYKIVEVLLENGGDINLKTDGISAIQIANDSNDERMIDLLKRFENNSQKIQITSKLNLNENGESKIKNNYQFNADIIRLNHLKYYGELLNEYYHIAGKYPFQYSEDKPVYVHIANEKQEKFTKQKLPFDNKIYSHKEFIKEIESVLLRNVEEYFDPQYSPDLKPNFYVYNVTGEKMFFAVHVSQKYSFSKKVSDGYFKVELSNMLIPYVGFYTYQFLKNNTEFNEIINNPINKIDYFLERENIFIHYSDD